MMFHFSADLAGDGTLQEGLVGTAVSESLKRVSVAYGKREQARQISFQVNDAPRVPAINDEGVCRIAIAQALQGPAGLYGSQTMEQPETQLNFDIPPWDGALSAVV